MGYMIWFILELTGILRRRWRGHYCRVYLDRALATASWSAMFPFASLWHLVIAKSVHLPIILFNDMGTSNRRIALIDLSGMRKCGRLMLISFRCLKGVVNKEEGQVCH